MLILRFITAGAVLVMAVGAAAAQNTAASDTAGKPVSLSQVAGQPAKTTAKSHSRFATRRAARRLARKSQERATEAAAEDADQPAQGAAAMAPTAAVNAPAAGTWATDATPLPGIATDATAPTVVPAIDQNLSALVVGGRTVQISEPDQFNAIDLAADHQATTPNGATDSQAPTPVAAVTQPDDNHSRDAWYEEIIAMLGGAAAAGTVAWLLIMGAAPQRMYG